MTRYYYFMEANGREITDISRLYLVKAGDGKSNERAISQLNRFALAFSCYFEIRSAESTSFIRMIENSVNVPFLMLMTEVKASDLLKHLRAGSRPPLSSLLLSNNHHFLKATSTDYLISSQIRAFLSA